MLAILLSSLSSLLSRGGDKSSSVIQHVQHVLLCQKKGSKIKQLGILIYL